MKTFFLKLAMASAGVLLISSVLSQSLSAQTVISFDSTPDNTMVLRIQNHELENKAHKYVFLFDSAKVTYEYNENGEIALHAYDLASGESAAAYSKGFDKKASAAAPEIQFNPIEFEDDVIDEEPMELEAWMISPKKWVN